MRKNKYLVEALRLVQARRFVDAMPLCKKAMRSQADYLTARYLLADCYYNHGVVEYFFARQLDSAERSFREAIGHNSDHAEAINNLAGLLSIQGRLDEAVHLYERLLALEPQRLTAYKDLVIALQQQDRLEEASSVLAELAKQMPNDGCAQLREATLIRSIIPSSDYPEIARGKIRSQIKKFEESGLLIANPAWFPGVYFYLSYHGILNRDIHEMIARATLKASPSLAWESPHLLSDNSAKTDYIRIGLASRFFYNHSIGHTSRGFVEKLDRKRFQVVVIHLAPPKSDFIANTINQGADEVCILEPKQSLQQARETIAGLKLDVLFWQDIGMEPLGYLLAFARLARVQFTSFGHPDTTGIPNIDYFLSSDLYETKDSHRHYSEKLICVEGYGTLSYYHKPPPPQGVWDKSKAGLSATDHIYLCPQTLFKIHPDMDEIFSGIVRKDPDARVVLIGNPENLMRKQLEARFAQTIPHSADHILFVPTRPHEAFLELLAAADVVLDTMHFNGQNTSLEAIAMGVPIVTLPGDLQRSRHTLGMYRAMGLPIWLLKTRWNTLISLSR